MNTIKLEHAHKPLMVAHRGCSGLERENTNAAFVAAGNRSYYGIETDVHRTLDGQYIIIHDDTTGRVAIDDLTVEKSTMETLRRLTLLNKGSERRDRSDLVFPTLAEYISICQRYEKYAVLELKNAFSEQDIAEICQIIREADYLDHTIFISFWYENLVLLRRLYPAAAAQFLVGKAVPPDLIDRLLDIHVDLDIYHKALTPELVEKCHENGIEVNVWTVDTLEDALRVTEMGVDYITSNILE